MTWKLIWRFEEDEGDAETYAENIAACTDPEMLRRWGMDWFEILGKLALDDYKGRAIIGKRLNLIDDRRKSLEKVPPEGETHAV